MKPTKKLELCIPRIPATTPREYIFQTFCRLKLGYIERIIEIPLKHVGYQIGGEKYKCVIIKMKWNLATEKAQSIYQRLLKKEPVFIVYDMPWYWKVVMNEMSTVVVAPPPYTPHLTPFEVQR